MIQSSPTLTERAVKQDRWIIIIGLALISLLSWSYLVSGAGTGMRMLLMSSWQFPPPLPVIPFENDWTLSYVIIMLLMWWVMMIAMMIPSAAPTILLYARVVRNSDPPVAVPATVIDHAPGETYDKRNSAVIPTAQFAMGYLSAWLIFSAAAVGAQYLFETSGLLHGMKMWSTNYAFSGLLLVVAGAYQLSSLKSACLRHCRSPAQYLANHWRRGSLGALRMGIGHGFYCIGCCWCLMALLFVGGAMNLVWIAALAILVLIEKTAPGTKITALLSASVLIGAGGYLLLFSLFPGYF